MLAGFFLVGMSHLWDDESTGFCQHWWRQKHPNEEDVCTISRLSPTTSHSLCLGFAEDDTKSISPSSSSQ